MSSQPSSTVKLEEGCKPLTGKIPLRYKYLLFDNAQAKTYLYASNNGQWRDVDPSNEYISRALGQETSKYLIIDNYSDMKEVSPPVGSISIINSRNNEELVLSLSVESQDMVSDHLKLLSSYRQYDVKTITIDLSKHITLINNNVIASDFKSKLDQLAKVCGVEIVISTKTETFTLNSSQSSSSNTGARSAYAYIIGESDRTLLAETKFRLLLDNEAGLFIDALNFPLSLVPSIGGVNFGNLKAIAKETGVNIYLPSLLPGLFNNDASDIPNSSLLYVSGLESQVQLAKKLLLGIKNKELEVYYKAIEIMKHKKDFILLNRKNELSTIIYKYGVFIQLSSLGADESVIHFQGPHSHLIELAIEDFLVLSNDIISLQASYTVEVTLDDEKWSEIEQLSQKIAVTSNIYLYCERATNAFQLIGLHDDVIKGFKMFHNYASSIFGSQQCITKTELELGLSYYDFISGKKNGKINKIIGSSNSSKIRFHSVNDYTFKIELSSLNIQDFFNTYLNLQNEFPSEFKFYIPESFHRQIIGTGGSLIQSIMRKYNVFVKFSNQYDMNLSNAKNLVRFDNVIIKCPFKNSSNIPLVQNELNTIIWNNSENSNILNTYIKINKNQYRLFDYRKVQEIEKRNQVFIKFPPMEFSEPFHVVEILGVDKNSIAASKSLRTQLASSYEFKISYSPNFTRFFNDEHDSFLERIRVPFKILYNFEVLPVANNSISKHSTAPHHSIILSYHTENNLFLEDAIQHLTQFLREFDFMILDRGELSNEDLVINGSAVNATVTPLPALQKQMFQADQLYPQYAQGFKSNTANGYSSSNSFPQGMHAPSNNRNNFKIQKRPNTTHNGYDLNSFNQKRPFS